MFVSNTPPSLSVLLILIIFILLLSFFISTYLGKREKRALQKPTGLSRHEKNPIISPKEEHWWESAGTFNPGVIEDSMGNVHLLYRATGSDGVSRFGYSQSKDGINFSERLPYPIFALCNPRQNISSSRKHFDFGLYPSGGSWGGAEDPRMVKIDGRIYVTFNAFDGWDHIRIGVVDIEEKNFIDKKWKWSKPLFISPKHQINKNWVLFPEKINGKFAILHSISPTIQIDYVDSMEQLATGKTTIKSHFGQKTPKEGWDSWWRGVGPPPLKTAKGWLVLYHATDQTDPHRYKLGALLLSLSNPKKIISRCANALLAPDMWYENNWKPGVIYACGALIKNDTLFVYYGGGDKYSAVARAPLDEILRKLKTV